MRCLCEIRRVYDRRISARSVDERTLDAFVLHICAILLIAIIVHLPEPLDLQWLREFGECCKTKVIGELKGER